MHVAMWHTLVHHNEPSDPTLLCNESFVIELGSLLCNCMNQNVQPIFFFLALLIGVALTIVALTFFFQEFMVSLSSHLPSEKRISFSIYIIFFSFSFIFSVPWIWHFYVVLSLACHPQSSAWVCIGISIIPLFPVERKNHMNGWLYMWCSFLHYSFHIQYLSSMCCSLKLLRIYAKCIFLAYDAFCDANTCILFEFQFQGTWQS